MAPETVLITGASSGIGRELAKCFAAAGSRLALVARSGGPLQATAEELRKLHKIDARAFPVDLARPDGPALAMNALQTAGFNKVDVLVNNAGFGAQGLFAELPLERQLQMLQVNITSLTHLTGLLLPGMIQRRRGGVLNVASTAAFQAGPRMAVYYASKAYVLSFSEALANEVAGTGVTISVLCPGPTDTNFIAAAGMRTSRLFKKNAMSATDVARIGYEAFRQKRVICVTGARNRLLAFATRLAPRSVTRKIAGALNASK
jgi:uncharacterized protein